MTPYLTAQFNADRIVIASFSKDHTATFNLSISIVNEGPVLAKMWAVNVHSAAARSITIAGPNSFERVGLPQYAPKLSEMAKANQSLFPSQQTEVIVQAVMPLNFQGSGSQQPSLTQLNFWQEDRFVPNFVKQDEADLTYVEFEVTLFADDTQPLKYTFELKVVDFWKKASDLLQESGLLK